MNSLKRSVSAVAWIILGVVIGVIGYRTLIESTGSSPRVAVSSQPVVVTNLVERNLAPEQLRELIKLRGEVAVLRNRVAELESVSTTPVAQAVEAASQSAPTGQGWSVYLQADEWSDRGLSTSEATAVSFLWALRTGNPRVYSEALAGKAKTEQFPVPWAAAFTAVEGARISDAGISTEGLPTVEIVYDLQGGDQAHGWLQFEQQEGSWKIKTLTGFPIALAQVQPQ